MSMLPLNGWIADGSWPSCDDEVDRLGARELDVGPGRVEVGVVGNPLAGAADDREEDLLGGPTLVCRDDVPEREQRLDALEEGEP